MKDTEISLETCTLEFWKQFHELTWSTGHFLLALVLIPSPISCSSIHSGTNYLHLSWQTLFLHFCPLQINLGKQVNQANYSSVTEFLLMGFSNLGKIQFILFAVFLCLYLIILSGNITIATVICLDCSLHILMYFFLRILSISETCYTFVILPKMLINLFSALDNLIY